MGYLRRCVKSGVVDGKEPAADGTYLPANVSKESWMDTEVEAELSMQSYLDRLDEELLNSLVSKTSGQNVQKAPALPVKLPQTAVVSITEKRVVSDT